MLLLGEYCAKFLVFSIFVLRCISSNGLGPCPKKDFMENFNLSRFTGHWYEIERSFYLMELIQSCVNVDLIENHKGRLEISVNTKSTWSGSFSISEGVAMPSKRNPSLLLYKVSSNLPRVINRYLPGAGFYQVLQTDYDNYAVIYSCTNFQLVYSGNQLHSLKSARMWLLDAVKLIKIDKAVLTLQTFKFTPNFLWCDHFDLIWIWGRRTEIDAETRAEIYSLLNKYSLDSERLILPKNDNCTDY